MAQINSDQQFVLYRIYQIRNISMSFKPSLPYRQETRKQFFFIYHNSALSIFDSVLTVTNVNKLFDYTFIYKVTRLTEPHNFS